MFGWLKRLLNRKSGGEGVSLDFFAIPGWLDANRSEKLSALEPHRKSVHDALVAKREELFSKIEVLRVAKLMNENIPERAKQMADGNKEEFLRRSVCFADSIQPPKIVDDVDGFLARISMSIKDYVEGTVRPLHVLSEFYAKEAKDIAGSVADVESIASGLRELHVGSGLAYFSELIHEHERLCKLISHRAGLAKTIAESRERHAKLQSDIVNVKAEIDVLEKSPTYGEFTELKNGIQNIQNDKRRIRQDILDWFGPLNPVLLHYESDKQFAGVVKRYLDDPASSLLEDVSLRILGVLRDANQRFLSGQLDVKDKRREKIAELLGNLDFLQQAHTRYRKAGNEENKLLSQLRAMPITQRLVALRKQLHDAEQAVPDAERVFSELERKLPNIDPHIEGFSSKLSVFCGLPVSISISSSGQLSPEVVSLR